MSARPRVVILGGGLAGLTTAWELSQGDWRGRVESITVYQRGWRLGGKGASSRGPHGRIEEHGLHVLLGYYDTTFRLLREVYAELDRVGTDPGCPIRTWREAVEPAADVGLADLDGQHWSSFVTRFATNDLVPGEPGAEDQPMRPVDAALRAVELLIAFQESVGAPSAGDGPGRVYLSASPTPEQSAPRTAALVRGAGLTALAGLLEVLERLVRFGDDQRLGGEQRAEPGLTGPANGMAAPAVAVLSAWRDGLREVVLAEEGGRRLWQLVDLVVTNLVGLLADGLLTDQRFDRIDGLDYRDWLARHGAAPETLDSAILHGMYDLVFAYEDGDRTRPRFAAGLGLQLAARMLFDFKGSLFWHMTAGMGEVVFAPLHQALAARGVEVRFFHRLDRLALDDADRSVSAVHLTRQCEPAEGYDQYSPLVRHDGLPCWPDAPLTDQLATDPGADAESHTWQGDGEPVTLRAGTDYDVAVLAVSIGMVPHVAAEVVTAVPRWQRMTEHVATVGTRAAQVWLDASEGELGWDGPVGVTLSGFGDTFDTWASMSHLLPREGWGQEPPRGAAMSTPSAPPNGSGSASGTARTPRSLAYFCSALPAQQTAVGQVHETLEQYLDTEVEALWPRAVDATGFRWNLLHDPQQREGPARLEAQYVRANTDPSDRYVQSLPGSGRHRLRPDDTGLTNLLVAGDWTRCGLDAGCAEAAARSGVIAARAILDRAARQPNGRR